jgi:CRP-like cAMP-binding protein
MSDPLFARFGREFPPGEVLFREGEPGDTMFVIQSGAARITKSVAGEEKLLAVLGPGEFLGELAILNSKPRTATATAVEPLRCLLVEAKTLEAMVAKSAEISLRLIKKLASRLDAANSLIEILMHTDPKARIMLALSRHADAYGERTEEGIRLRTTTADIASEVGVQEDVAIDVITRLRRLRLVSDEGGELVVADVGRLQEFLEFIESPPPGGEG